MADSRRSSAGNLFFGVCLGALFALVVGYAATYALTHFGLGVVSGSDKSLAGGIEIFARSALNFYAMQHAVLVGEGKDVFAAITTPLSLWAILPGLAIILGGYTAAATSGARGRGGKMVCALCAGVLYALVLTAASRVIHARIDSFLMPEVAGVQSNPQDFPFRPGTRSTLLCAGIFGVIFSYLGGLMASRTPGSAGAPGKWWACVKAVVVVAVVMQLILLASAASVYKNPEKKEGDESRWASVVEMLPTVSGLGYSLINGGTLVAGMESSVHSTGKSSRPFYAQVSLLGGILRQDAKEQSRRPLPSGVVAIAVVLAGLGAVLMGRLAVRWGSRDGSLPTAIRVALVNTAYLALLVIFCNAVLITTDPVSASAIRTQLCWGVWLLYSFFWVLVLALVGAGTGGRRTSAPMEV